MISLAIACLIVVLLTAILGFGGIVGATLATTQLVFVVALVGFGLSAMAGVARLRD
ncbi:DUF1328 domain-containing protein [Phreatobacter aquaticus]|uniref:DUF1328 domain-containing protein n=1 Tax=Phreatobacter aquaticus TaxID=2570229 RepID=A0A4D7QGU5_9HYPH|nr:DUF1328 domain-containing protein [Phreatobacter aquaticus]QCK85069.1 DUF1328 domain-containing protein [Phreatobacter aquaticus]